MAKTPTKTKSNESQPKYKEEERVIQQFGTLNDLPLALEANARSRSVGVLNQILVDTMMLRDLYKKAHWQISGATFYSLHLLLDKHYEEQAEAVDTIAERIMALGGLSYATPQDIAETTSIERPPQGREDVPSNLQRLLEAHRKCLAYMRPAASEAAEYGDDGTNDLIVSDLIRTHEAQIWFIAEHLASTRILPATADGGPVPS